jgi:hypothetical protein
MPRPHSRPWASGATVAPRRLPPSRRSQRQPRSSPFARRRPEFSAATSGKQHGNAAPAIEPSSARASIHEVGTNGAYPSPCGPGLHVRPTLGDESRIATAFRWGATQAGTTPSVAFRAIIGRDDEIELGVTL